MTVCIGTAPFALTGASPGGGTYSGPGVSAGTFSPAVAGLGTHIITYTESGCTCTFTITVNAVNTWLGVNNDWFNPANWTCGVPTSGVDVMIPPGGMHPIISALTAEAKSLLVNSGALLMVQSRLDLFGSLSLQGQMQSAPGSSVHFRGSGTRIIDGMPGPIPPSSFFDVFVELDPGASLGFGAGVSKVNANNIYVQNGIVTAPVEIEMVQLELTGGTYNAGATTRLSGDYVRTGTAVFNHGNGSLILEGSGSRDVLSNFPLESFFDIFIDLAPTGSATFGGMTKVNARNVNVQQGSVNMPVEIEMVQLNLTGGTFNAGPKTTLNGGYSRSGGTFNPGSGELVIKGPGSHPIHSDFPLESFFDITYDIPAGTSAFPGATTKVMANNVKLLDGTVTMPVEIEMVQLDLQGGTWNAGNKTVLNGDYIRTGGSFVPGTGEIRFKGSGIIDAPVTESFFDIFIELGSVTRDAGGNLDKLYARNLTMEGGVFNAPVEVEMVQLELNGGTYNAGASTKLSGNFENNAGTLAYNPATGILEIGGAASLQTLGGSFPTTFYKLHTSNTSGGVEVTDDISITNELCILSGILINNATITNTGTKCDGGTYMGSGTYNGSVFINDGGTIAPGGSPGCTVFGSGLDNTGGTIDIEISGTTACTQYDQVQVTGTAILGGGTLDVSIPSYTPSCGESYTILTATVAVTGTFGTINYPALPTGLGWSIQYNATTVVLTIVGTNEINVKGNAVTISDGDITPDLADHTEFGNVSTSGNLVRTYTIENTGTADLTISSITKSGPDAGLFTLGALTPASPIPAAGSATFTVTFAPTTTGLKTTTININNNDCDEALYNYDVQGTGVATVFTVHNITQGTHFTTIQAAINDGATTNGDHITVDAGLYNEDVTVNKQLRIQGAGASTTTVSGPIGGAGATFTVAASGVIIEDFTITRDGNNTTDWNDGGLNIAGVAVQGLTADAEVRNCIITGMRTGIDINNSIGNKIHNNTIDNNRTGLIFRNQTDNTILEENFITNNWTVGVLFLDASGGTNSPVQQALNSSFRYNNISGNWYGQVVDRQTGGSLPAPGTTNLKNFKCNWYGSTSPVTSTANSAEPGYSALIPVMYGGTSVPPGGQPDILGAASANIIYQPFLNSGTDNVPASNGFQPVPGSCAGCATGALVTNTNTGDVFCSIQAAIDDPFTLDGHKLSVAAGTFIENVVVDKELEIQGAGVGLTTVIPAVSNPNTGGGSLPGSNVFLIQASNVRIHDLTIDGDNPALTSAENYGGANMDARNGIITDHLSGVYNNLEVDHTEIKNIYLRGIYASTGGSFNLHHNTVTNVQGNAGSIGIFNWAGAGTISNNTVSDCNDAISTNHSSGTVMSYNTVTNCGSGLHSDNNGDGGGVADQISNNSVQNSPANGYGIFVFAPYKNVLVEKNTITNVEVGLASAGTYAGSSPVFRENVVDAAMKANSIGVYSTTEIWGYTSGSQSASFLNNEIKNHVKAFLLASEAGYTNSSIIQENSVTGNTTLVKLAQDYTEVPPTGTFALTMNCNWWGTTSAATIASLISGGSVPYIPFLTSGVDTDVPAIGFQPGAGTCNGYAPVLNTNTMLSYFTIQAAIDDPLTLNGHSITVAAGTYTENVLVNKELTITGAGKGSNPASNTVVTAPVSCTGTGFTISAANVTLQNMYVTGFQDAVLLNGVSSPKINNMALIDYCRYGVNFGGSNTDVEITGTDIQRTSLLAGTIGMRIGTANAVNGLLIDNCTITGNALQGIVNFQATTPVAFDNITIRNSTISNNLQKGLYFEKLSNALLENLTMDNNGTDATYGFNNGIDINLKYGSYSNITIQNCDITNSGSNGTATDPQNAAVIAIKARDDASSYNTIPASLNTVLIKNNRITGPQNGIRLGEFGKLNATPTNVTIEGNDLSHAFAGKAIVSRINADAQVVCNWHGSTNLAAILATFTEAGSGNLLLGTVLGSGTDGSAAVGFQPLASCVCANGNLVTNTTTLATYCSIQAAIDDPLTLDGHTLQVGAGTYIENVIVNKQLSILGPNAAIDPCSGTRVAEAIVVPATKAISSGEIFHVAASNVTISGFTIDGDNTALTSGFTSTNGADIDAAEGITVYETGVNNLTVTNNIIQNLSYFGVTLYDYPAAVPSSGHVISNNKIRDLGTYDATSTIDFWGGAVLLYNNQYAAVTNNCMSNVRVGVQTGNFHLANPGAPASQLISGNTIAARRRGIFHNLFYGSASPYTLSNNTITGIVDANETVWDGILIASQAIASTASNNSINGTGITNPSEGIEVWNSLPAPLISGGTISNVSIGISVNNYEGYNSNANNTAATISGVTISGTTNAGIKVHDNALNTNGATVSADIQGNTVINTGTRGLVITGAGASAVFTGANPASFSGQTVYIDLESNGTDVPAGNIDATAVLFDGQTGATATFAQNFAIEDKINHKIENQALGFVTVKAGNAFVTDIAAPAATNNDYTRIRNAVGLVSSNWNINLKGTFDWTEANAATSWSLGNDAVVSAADDYSILVPANLNGITFTAPEGLGTATIQGPGDLSTANLEGVLVFDGGDNQNWTISNLELFDFDMPLGFFNGAGGTDAFNGTTIQNNHIRIPKDLNLTAAPSDANQNIGIHYSFGINQTISGNTFTVDGTGVSAGANRSTSIVMQSNTSGGTAYDGLKIINNTVIVTGDPDPVDPAVIRGFWENGHNTDADIEISGNIFSNASSTNLASQNRQFGMWQTSHSGATKNVVYKNNEFSGWNTGISSLGGLYTVNTPPGYETGEMPVLAQNNKFDKVQYGVVVRKSATSTNPGSPFIVNENSFTNPVAGGFAVSNESSGLTNAECNWYGSVLPGVVSGSVSANVDVIPFLVNGADNSAATGFQPVPGSCTGIGPVLNTNTLISYFTIQAAIDDPATLNGHTITVAAGTYTENVIVNKQLSILGPNAAIDPCSGTRVAEAIVVPATAAISSGEIFHVAASNVTISGFTIDGDNTALSSGFTSTNGADIDAAEGITVYETGVNNLTVTNNIIQNLSYFGVTLYDYPAAVPSSGHVISNNRIRDLGTYDATSTIDFWGGAVLLYNNQYAAVTNNCMTNVRIGVQTGNFHLANPGAPASQLISGNTIAARRRGIFHNLFYGSASPYTLSNNTITGIVDANEIVWDGILIASQAIASTASNNSINGTGITNPSEGIEVWNSLPAPLISGGTITGVGIGISVNNFEGYSSDANNTSATIDAVTITGATIAGIKVHDNPSNSNGATVSAEIKGNTNISGSPAGILVTGSDASANIHDNSASITGNTIGVDIENSATVSPLYRNNISANGTGVRVRSGGNLGLTTENFITNNTVEGIRVEATAGTIGNINSNDLSGNTGLAINNLAAALLNATCNWYGSNVPATVAAEVSANVTYIPYLSAGTDDGNPANGFQPAVACSAPCTTTVGGPTAVCVGANITMTTPAASGSWSSNDPTKAIIDATTGVVTGVAAGPVTFTFTEINGCSATTATVMVHALPVPTITGPTPVCANSAGHVYTTEAGMSAYVWNVTGGVVTGGGTATDHTITISWGVAGTGHVTVLYTDPNGCTAATATDYPVTIDARPVITISGAATVCSGSTGNIYTTQAGQSNYVWTVTGGTITAGGGSGDPTVTVTWGAAGSGQVTVNYTNPAGCPATTPTVYPVTINPIPDVANPGNQLYCNHVNTTPIVFSSSTTGPGTVSFTWTNNNTTIGLAASGSGDIPSFLTSNTSFTTANTATIIVTPHYTYNSVTCDGPPQTFTITVQPASNGSITGASNTTICAGQGASVNVVLNGVPNFTGSFRIREILDPIGPVFGPAVFTAPPFSSGFTGLQAVAVDGSYLPNITAMPKIYRVDWNTLTDGNGCTAYPMLGFVDITVSPSVPVFTFCPANVTNVAVNNTGCTAIYTTPNPVATVNCGSLVSLTWVMSGATTGASPIAGINYAGTQTFNTGTTTVTYTATDNFGHTATCTFTVQVVNTLTGTVSGSVTVVQDVTSSPVTFSGSGGALPYTFTYKVNAGPDVVVTTTGGSSSVVVNQPNNTVGSFVYTLVSITDANGCTGALPFSTSATVTVVNTTTPDLTSAVSQPLNSTFFTGQVKEGFVTLSNVTPNPTTGTITFRVSLVANFDLEILGSTIAVTPPGSVLTAVNNNDWDITAGPIFYTISSKPGVVINGGSSVKIGYKLTATGGANSSGLMTVTILNGTGGSTPLNGDNNNSNNQSVKLFGIN